MAHPRHVLLTGQSTHNSASSLLSVSVVKESMTLRPPPTPLNLFYMLHFLHHYQVVKGDFLIKYYMNNYIWWENHVMNLLESVRGWALPIDSFKEHCDAADELVVIKGSVTLRPLLLCFHHHCLWEARLKNGTHTSVKYYLGRCMGRFCLWMHDRDHSIWGCWRCTKNLSVSQVVSVKVPIMGMTVRAHHEHIKSTHTTKNIQRLVRNLTAFYLPSNCIMISCNLCIICHPLQRILGSQFHVQF